MQRINFTLIAVVCSRMPNRHVTLCAHSSSRSRTSRWTVSRTTWRPRRSCCCGLSAWWRATQACAVTTSPPAGETASSSVQSSTNTGEKELLGKPGGFPQFAEGPIFKVVPYRGYTLPTKFDKTQTTTGILTDHFFNLLWNSVKHNLTRGVGIN